MARTSSQLATAVLLDAVLRRRPATLKKLAGSDAAQGRGLQELAEPRCPSASIRGLRAAGNGFWPWLRSGWRLPQRLRGLLETSPFGPPVGTPSVAGADRLLTQPCLQKTR
jgi:hypothetical protein